MPIGTSLPTPCSNVRDWLFASWRLQLAASSEPSSSNPFKGKWRLSRLFVIEITKLRVRVNGKKSDRRDVASHVSRDAGHCVIRISAGVRNYSSLIRLEKSTTRLTKCALVHPILWCFVRVRPRDREHLIFFDPGTSSFVLSPTRARPDQPWQSALPSGVLPWPSLNWSDPSRVLCISVVEV